jgi:ubiquinone/menaquinone biosynthesis C-methylase UbiE
MDLYKSKISQYYSREDKNDKYEKKWGYQNPLASSYWELRDALIGAVFSKYVQVKKERLTVLEFGCGHGHELHKFTRFGVPEEGLTGFDLIFGRLKRARKQYPDCRFSQHDALTAGFKDNEFDIVFQFTCAMHLPEANLQKALAREMVRVLKPGGLLLWWDLTPYSGRTCSARRLCFLFKRKQWLGAMGLGCLFFLQCLLPRMAPFSGGSAVDEGIRPISKKELKGMFGRQIVFCRGAGLDYDIWKFLFPRLPALARFLWRRGWFNQHCFCAAVKRPR